MRTSGANDNNQPRPVSTRSNPLIKNTSALLLLSVFVCVSENLAVNSDAVQSGGGNLKTNNETDGQTQMEMSALSFNICDHCPCHAPSIECFSHLMHSSVQV
jgi:hypothetical protein